MTANVVNFVGREPAWHSIGTVIDRNLDLDPIAALVLAGADYEVRTTKLVTEAFGTRIDTGRVAIVRAPTGFDPQPRVLGVATKNYRPIQNVELMRLIAQVSDEHAWPVETVGVLGRGEKFFTTLQTGTVEIPGDTSPVSLFYFLASGHDGGTAVKIGVTPVRIVCQNTLILGLASATISAAVAHVHDAAGELAFNVDTIARMQAASESVTAAMRLLAATPVPADRLEPIFDTAYPEYVGGSSLDRARQFLNGTVTLTDDRRKQLESKVTKATNWNESVKAYRASALERFVAFNDEFPQVANTPWAAYNAVAEVEAHRAGKSKSVVGRDVLFSGPRGQRIEAAWNAAYAVAKATN